MDPSKHHSPDVPCPLLCLRASPHTTSSMKKGLPRTQQAPSALSPYAGKAFCQTPTFPGSCSLQDLSMSIPAQASVLLLLLLPAAQLEAFVTERGKLCQSPLFSLSTTSLKSQGSSLPFHFFLKGSASRREAPFHVSATLSLSLSVQFQYLHAETGDPKADKVSVADTCI